MKRWALGMVTIGLLVGVVGAAQADRHGHWHGGHGGGSRIFLGIGPYWDPFWYPYPRYYAPPSTVVVTPPTTYVQPEPKERAGDYWYYCTSPEGYYPYIKQCPQGWLKVVPQPPPS